MELLTFLIKAGAPIEMLQKAISMEAQAPAAQAPAAQAPAAQAPAAQAPAAQAPADVITELASTVEKLTSTVEKLAARQNTFSGIDAEPQTSEQIANEAIASIMFSENYR